MSDGSEKFEDEKPEATELPHRMTIDEPTGLTIRGDGVGEPIKFFPDEGDD